MTLYRTTVAAICGLALTAVAVLATSGSAQAAAPIPIPSAPTDSALPPAAVNNPKVPLSTIKALPQIVQNDPSVTIDPNLDPNKPLIYPNGQAVPGQSTAAVQRAATMCKAQVWGPMLGQWSGAVSGSCSVWGSPGWTQGYKWGPAPGVTTSACVQATSWVPQSPGSRLSNEVWRGIGCGRGGGATLPWGNVIATPKFKATSTGGLSGTTVIITY